MRIPLLVLLYILITSVNLQADNDSLLIKNANAIINNLAVEIKINSEQKAVCQIEKEILVLNKNGDKHAFFAEYYDKFRKIKSFTGKIYNSEDEIVGRIFYPNLNDRSLINDFSLYEDNRIKYYKPLQVKYPYKVVYKYSIEYNGLLNLPSWQPLESSHVAIKNATLKVIQKKDNLLRYKTIKIGDPEIREDDNEVIYLWSVSNIEARKKEPYRLPYDRTSPTVHLAPVKFSHGGYEGEMKNWEEFGKWRYELIKDRTELPQEAISDIYHMVHDFSDTLENIKRIYSYMQNRTRYVSIQEGIGGWQPIDAETVHSTGYGDCKALTNYTKALLQKVGVESIYTVIRAGSRECDILTDFTSNQSNHAILCVPFKKDTIWLECTDQKAPFGYLGSFTTNRHALLITEEGGKLVKTPKYDSDKNNQIRFSKVEILDNGNASASFKTVYSGLQFENIDYLLDKHSTDQEELMLKRLDVNDFKINNLELGYKFEPDLFAYDTMDIHINSFASTSGSRIFFQLNLFNRNSYIPLELDRRVSPIWFSFPYIDVDSTEFVIPTGYEIEYIPESMHEKNQFGEYTVHIEEKGNQLIYSRKLVINSGIFPAEDYDELIKFFKLISTYDNKKCMLKRIN